MSYVETTTFYNPSVLQTYISKICNFKLRIFNSKLIFCILYFHNLPSKHPSWWRRLEDVFCLRLQKTSPRRLQDVLVKTNIFVLAIRLQDVFKAFSRRLQDALQKRLQGIFKTSPRRLQNVFKTPSRRLQDVSSS